MENAIISYLNILRLYAMSIRKLGNYKFFSCKRFGPNFAFLFLSLLWQLRLFARMDRGISLKPYQTMTADGLV